MSRATAVVRLPVVGFLLAAVTLGAWALATPIGSSPDDDFHLTSVWCAESAADLGLCKTPNGEFSDRAREVPEALTLAACFAGDTSASAGCQRTEIDWDPTVTTVTERSNQNGGYPPVYYFTMGLLASENLQASALTMRLASVALLLALVSGLWAFLPPHQRGALIWTWLVGGVPLGLFLIASNNPSGWAIGGVPLSVLALVGYFRAEDKRSSIGLAVTFVVAALAAAGARGDAAVYVGVGTLVAAVLTYPAARAGRPDLLRWWKRAILPGAVGLLCLRLFLGARQVASGISGFSTPPTAGSAVDAAEVTLEGASLLAFNVLHLPALWGGLLPEAGLGWLDTPMPPLVAFAVWAVMIGVIAVTVSGLDRRSAIAASFVALLLTALPLYVLQAGGDRVGQQVQPRYLLPLIMVLFVILLLNRALAGVRIERPLVWLMSCAVIGAHFVALHVTIRRFVTGADVAGFSLGEGAEWWWGAGLPGPDAVWLTGSIAFAGFVLWAIPAIACSRRDQPQLAAVSRCR